MEKICGIVSYKGTNYYGWERQLDKPSVQFEVEHVLSKILNSKIVVKVAGRTDRGVHALRQVFTFILKNKVLDLDRIKYSVNRLLPNDIKILSFKKVDINFDPKIHAIKKEYQYQIYLGENTPFYKDFCEIINPKINFKKMLEIKDLFLGEHNFKNYTINKTDSKNFKRTIYSLDVTKTKDIVFINVVGNGFMRYMVRFIVGDLILYCKDQITKNGILKKLNAEKNCEKRLKASACGLFLKEVSYGDKF